MHIHVDIELPALPKRRTRRIALALVLALAVAVPGLALASHQFGDVPNANPFHGDISAIANAGVTSGCGGGNYCPDRNVTRGEMAAFMNRLGALSSNKTPVVNADKVDGLDSTAFSRPAYATMRPDECFHAGGICTIYNVRDVRSIRRIATGTYCVAPPSGRSFAGITPTLTIDGFHSGPSTGFGTPIVTYSSFVSPCSNGEIKVLTYSAFGTDPTISLSDYSSFGIVIP